MAKRAKQRGEKSAAIREYREKNPDAKPKEISEQLNQLGFNVTPQYVSTILSNAKRDGKSKGTKARRGRPRREAAPATGAFENLLAVKKFIDKVGGIEAAQTAISQYSQLLA